MLSGVSSSPTWQDKWGYRICHQILNKWQTASNGLFWISEPLGSMLIAIKSANRELIMDFLQRQLASLDRQLVSFLMQICMNLQDLLSNQEALQQFYVTRNLHAVSQFVDSQYCLLTTRLSALGIQTPCDSRRQMLAAIPIFVCLQRHNKRPSEDNLKVAASMF